MYVCMYVCMCMHMCVYTCVYVCVFVCVYVCVCCVVELTTTLTFSLFLGGRRIGCAFIQYSSVFDASRAIKHMNGQDIQGIVKYSNG